MILDKIVNVKRKQLEFEKKRMSIEDWKKRINSSSLPSPLDFKKLLSAEKGVSIIAEIKKASPSKGIIREDFDPAIIAKEYIKGGASAISVLTEKNFFSGDNHYLQVVKNISPIPVLRKDFIIDPYQIYEARYLGADIILLIAAILREKELKKFMIISQILGMQCLVEVHSEEELEKALRCGADIIGINNRDLKTFQVDIRTTERIISKIPGGVFVVSESGIKDYQDIKYLEYCGVDACLIGETLMKAGDRVRKLMELKGEITSVSNKKIALV